MSNGVPALNFHGIFIVSIDDLEVDHFIDRDLVAIVSKENWHKIEDMLIGDFGTAVVTQTKEDFEKYIKRVQNE